MSATMAKGVVTHIYHTLGYFNHILVTSVASFCKHAVSVDSPRSKYSTCASDYVIGDYVIGDYVIGNYVIGDYVIGHYAWLLTYM